LVQAEQSIMMATPQWEDLRWFIHRAVHRAEAAGGRIQIFDIDPVVSSIIEYLVRAEARKLASMGTGTYLRELALHNFDGDYYNRVDLLKWVVLPEDNWKKARHVDKCHPSFQYKPIAPAVGPTRFEQRCFPCLANKRDSKQLDEQLCAGVAPMTRQSQRMLVLE